MLDHERCGCTKKLLPEIAGLEVDRGGLGRNAHENGALGVNDRC